MKSLQTIKNAEELPKIQEELESRKAALNAVSFFKILFVYIKVKRACHLTFRKTSILVKSCTIYCLKVMHYYHYFYDILHKAKADIVVCYQSMCLCQFFQDHKYK